MPAATQHGGGLLAYRYRLQHWAEPPHWQALHQVFGHFDAADAERAFHATLRLYSQVAREVAARASFDYPAAVEAGIRDLIRAPV